MLYDYYHDLIIDMGGNVYKVNTVGSEDEEAEEVLCSECLKNKKPCELSNDYDRRDDYELIQYTGLKDKNGKEVWEGDIVLQLSNSIKKKPELVVFEKGCFHAGFHDGSSTMRRPKLLSSKVEVIGNKFENPELLVPTPTK